MNQPGEQELAQGYVDVASVQAGLVAKRVRVPRAAGAHCSEQGHGQIGDIGIDCTTPGGHRTFLEGLTRSAIEGQLPVGVALDPKVTLVNATVAARA